MALDFARRLSRFATNWDRAVEAHIFVILCAVYNCLSIFTEVEVDINNFGAVYIMHRLQVLVQVASVYLLVADIALDLSCLPIPCQLYPLLALFTGLV